MPTWVVVEDGKIINKNPTKEELICLEEEPYKIQRPKKYTKRQILEYIIKFYEDNGRLPMRTDFMDNHKYPSPSMVQYHFGSWNNAIRDTGLWNKRYNDTHICDRCGRSFEDLDKSGGYPFREYDKKGNWNGNWNCPDCYQKYDPNSSHNIDKERRDFRNDNLNQNSPTGKGYICEQITCIARGIKNLNIEKDNFNVPIDHSIDPEYGIVQSKCAIYNSIYRMWKLHTENEQEKDFDYLFIYCMSKDMKNIERVYIIPWEEVIKRKSISIVKNPSKGIQWYEKYRVDEKPYNDIYHCMNIYNCPVLRKEK